MNKLIITLVIAAIAVLVIVWFSGQGPVETDVVEETETVEESMEEGTETDDQEMADDSSVQEFTVDGTEFAFSMDEITVNKGDVIRVTFRNTGDMPHDFVIDEFDVATEILNPGEEEVVEFSVDQVGEFEYYCSVGSHRQQGMFGSLSVE